MNDNMIKIMSLSVIVESLITYFKEFFVYGCFSISMIFSIIFGISIAIIYKLDLHECFNLKSTVTYVGNILTGLLISKESNYIYDVLNCHRHKIKSH